MRTSDERLGEMVKENSDYVVEEMTRELKYGEDVKGALNVFGGLLSISPTLSAHSNLFRTGSCTTG